MDTNDSAFPYQILETPDGDRTRPDRDDAIAAAEAAGLTSDHVWSVTTSSEECLNPEDFWETFGPNHHWVNVDGWAVSTEACRGRYFEEHVRGCDYE